MLKHAFVGICGVFLSSPAIAAFEIVAEQKFGDWRAVLYENPNGRGRFCAVETEADNRIFRINSYLASGFTFLEVYDPQWQLLPGQVSFTVSFTMPDQNLAAVLQGNRETTAYTHDFSELQNYQMTLGMLMSSTKLDVENSNGTVIASFSGKGADGAVPTYNDCVSSKGESLTTAAFRPSATNADPQFADYPAAVSHRGPTVLPDFDGSERQFRDFRTRIRNGMNEGPNFAGHHSLVVIGCGTACTFAIGGDNSSGQLVGFPLGGESNPYMALSYRRDSSLIIAQWQDYEANACLRQGFRLQDMAFEEVEPARRVGTRDDCYEEIPAQ